MAFSYAFNEEKNQILKASRGIGFDDVIRHMKSGELLADKEHPNPKRPDQRIYIVKIDDYVYVVPYVINVQRKEHFLKTVYPSRTYTKQYIKAGGTNGK